MQSYRVVTSNTPEGLSEAVEKLLNEGGYYLQGGVSVALVENAQVYGGGTGVYAQALYRVDLSEHAQKLVEQEAVA